ncbi:FHA domain-containing protein [Nocardia flavorosea]|uniref:FHA domain-containing protein n=1 Tax=Nocardia flavorosea TaxID=53429 RepID=UPI001E37A8E9|nr:FHA domain-containing protein [Nocardia flavorosea]
MQDQQVEVVSGPHAVARVAGAVVLVAHRGDGRPTSNSPAVRALVALAELVYEAAARQPEGPGAAIAREATRWLMAYAARSDPGGSVDFGILSAAGPDRVAIFLHGAVTAVVAGESTEYFHGRDAAFTVDRTAPVPSRAVALFVDDPLADPDDDAARPELPAARGIGRLVEGIAEAGAAIAWAPAVRQAAASTGPGRSSGVVLGKRAVRGTREEPAESLVAPEVSPLSSGGPGTASEPAGTAASIGSIPGDPEAGGVVGPAATRIGTADGPASGGASEFAANPAAISPADRGPEGAAQYSGSAGNPVADAFPGEPGAVPAPPDGVDSSRIVERRPDDEDRPENAGIDAGHPGAGNASEPVAQNSAVAAADPKAAQARTLAAGSASPAADPGTVSKATAAGFGDGNPPQTGPAGAAPAEENAEFAGEAEGETGDRGPADGVHPPGADRHHAQTQISGRQPQRPTRSGEVADETADSRPGRTDPSRRPAHRTPRMDMPLPQPTPTDRPGHGPPEHGTPPLAAELRRRTEATAKGTALTVKVRGFKCARAHPTDPRSAFCSVCGMPVDQTQPLIEVMRPPLGILVLDDGSTYLLETDSVLGRDPEKAEPVRRGLTPLQVTDNSGGMSRAHAELRLVEWDVTLIDRGSTNGTRTRAPGFREWVRVPPHQPVILVPGTEILIGNRMLRLESAAPPPFGS